MKLRGGGKRSRKETWFQKMSQLHGGGGGGGRDVFKLSQNTMSQHGGRGGGGQGAWDKFPSFAVFFFEVIPNTKYQWTPPKLERAYAKNNYQTQLLAEA